MIFLTGLYDSPRITAFNARADNANGPICIIHEPKIYLPQSVNNTIPAIIQTIYFREKMSGALCE